MSKRLKNYPDPVEVVNKYGVDALRWVGLLALLYSAIFTGEVFDGLSSIKILPIKYTKL